MLTLHLAKGTISLAAHIALGEIGADHELVWVSFAKAEQAAPAYRALNPKGRVPTLITDHGALTETAAILRYLVACHPAAGLMPDDPWQAAKVDEMMLYLASTVHVSHAHKMRGHRWADDPAAHTAMRAKVTQNMADGFGLVETQLGAGPWVLGDTYSLADIYLYTVARWLEGDGVPLADLPRVAAHFAAMERRPAVQKAIALHA